MASDLENLIAIKSSLLSALASETAYQAVNGAKPSYSLDGESYQWTEWREALLRKVGVLNTLIQNEQSPFLISSRARP